ncbi:Ras family [Pelomyxa schiedti]|nr:Ras family [Pelomyxa schiedti]
MMRDGTVGVFGPPGVGKTALAESFVCGHWRPEEYDGSLEITFRRQVSTDGEKFALDIIDCSREDYSRMQDALISKANIILLCFSLADRRTFEEAVEMDFQRIRRSSEETIILLVGLKMDLVTEVPGSCVTFQEGVSAATEIKAYGYFQCSSKTYVGLDALFEEVCRAGKFSGSGSGTTHPKKSGLFGWFSKKPKSISSESNSLVQIPTATIIQPVVSLIPNDIWLLVLDYLDFVALIRICRTCKQFYHLAKIVFPGAMSRPYNYCGCLKVPCWKNNSFTWAPAKRFHEYTYSPVSSLSSSHRRSSSDDRTVCFGPDCTILMSSGNLCPIKHLRVGDSVLAYYYDVCDTAPAVVQCIWKCPVRKPIPMVVIVQKSTTTDAVLELTPDHPILLLHHNQQSLWEQQSPHSHPKSNNQPESETNLTITNQWCLPTTLCRPHMVRMGYVYNLVLESHQGAVIVPAQSRDNERGGGTQFSGPESVACCALGMSVPGHPDDWWGTHKVIQWLESRPDFPYVTSPPP